MKWGTKTFRPTPRDLRVSGPRLKVETPYVVVKWSGETPLKVETVTPSTLTDGVSDHLPGYSIKFLFKLLTKEHSTPFLIKFWKSESNPILYGHNKVPWLYP